MQSHENSSGVLITRTAIFGVVLLAAVCVASTARPQGTTGQPVPVTVENFARAESDYYMGNAIRDYGAFGKLAHLRQPADIDKQAVIRLNRDTLYSTGVFDLEAGPVTITMPNPGKRFMALQLINEDHYVPNVFYGAGTHTLTKDNIGTRYVQVGIRTLVDPSDPKDVEEVHKLQDSIKVTQKSAGKFEIPSWDQDSQKKIRDALLVLSASTDGFKNAFGRKGEVDPVHRLIATAAAWGGNPARDATYISETPANNDGKTIHKLRVPGSVPVDGFWSVSLYNAQGYFEKNDLNAYSLNNITAKKSADGTFDIQFGGCDGKIPNCLPVMNGWNYTVRLYRPRAEILNGKWTFPKAQPVAAEGRAVKE